MRVRRGCSAINRPAWSDNLNLAKRLIPAQAGAARREIHAVEAALESLPRSRENFGLIHYDFELDNLMWDSGHIGILDFDDCAYCWFAADIAYALRDLFADRVGGVDLDDASLQSFVRGYRDEQPLSDEEIERLPLYLRLHNLVSYARITRALGESASATEPEWASALRAKLLATLDAYRDDFRDFPVTATG